MANNQREQIRVVAEKAVLVAVLLPNSLHGPDDALDELSALAERQVMTGHDGVVVAPRKKETVLKLPSSIDPSIAEQLV